MVDQAQISKKVTLLPQDQPSSKGWRGNLVRLGRWKALILVCVFSILTSLGFGFIFTWLFHSAPEDRPTYLLSAVLIPLLIAPPVVHFLMQLLFELDQTRAELLNMATRDSLTHVYNRRFFMESFEIETTRALRTHSQMSLLMIDIDDFKLVNDRYGHATGDRLLQGISQSLMTTLRPYDVLARFGGEEFVVLLPSLSLQDACEVAERLRLAVLELKTQTDKGLSIGVTISLGISALSANTSNAYSLLKQADDALYSAKRAGKNRWAS